MMQTHDDDDNLTDYDNTTSLSDSNEGDMTDNDTVVVQGTTFTKDEIEQANKPQPNVILNTIDVGRETASSYKDPDRVNPRSNQASDSTDSNTGGIIAGGAKGTSQS